MFLLSKKPDKPGVMCITLGQKKGQVLIINMEMKGRKALGGLTISLDGGLEEFDEFLESLAICSASSVFFFTRASLALRSSATCFSKVLIRTSRCLN